MELKTGFIQVLAGKPKNEKIEILYYPTEFSMEKSNSFAEIAIPGLESPYLEYVKGNAGSITLEVFYDTYEEKQDVRELTDKLTNLMNIDPVLHAPPPLLFTWGVSQEPFTCVLERVTKKFTLFLKPDGKNSSPIPVRAELNITLKEFKFDLNDREGKRQSPDKTKIYITQQKDSLWAIAHREYGSPLMWRPIADKNKIYNPRQLMPGTELIIPSLG